jgi:hypothetical protein
MNLPRLPLFECRYRSDGRIYTCRIRAASAAQAEEKLRQLDWAPGCGPVEAPFRIFEGAMMMDEAVPATAAAGAALARTVIAATGKWVGAALDMIAEPFHPHRRHRRFHNHGPAHG